MSIHLSNNSVDAGANVSIRVNTSAAGSYVGIRAVDQSILLLKSGKDITEARVRLLSFFRNKALLLT